METTLLALELNNVLKEMKKMLLEKGFIVQTMPTSNPIIVAHKKANWWRKSKQLIIEIIGVEKNVTRVEITAIVNSAKNKHAEENIEESFAASVCNTFKKVISPSYGFR